MGNGALRADAVGAKFVMPLQPNGHFFGFAGSRQNPDAIALQPAKDHRPAGTAAPAACHF